ncbi:MAG: siderophore-interacting protein [Pseudorhodobacter sp.]
MEFPLTSEAALPGLPFVQISALLQQEAQAHGLDLDRVQDHAGRESQIICKLADGEIGARSWAEGSILHVRAASPDWLFTLRETVTSHLTETAPEQAILLRWSDLAHPGKTPPNFSLAEVEDLKPLGDHFFRLRLRGDNLDRLARDMIHFRLILPRPDVTRPQWPVTGANGQTIWPEGAHALHRPAYTVRAIDPAAGWLDADIFRHPGGRVCTWASGIEKGAQVGLTGPGGGGVPVAQNLLIGGDETAYPALARSIEAQSPECEGQCWLFGHVKDYPLPCHPRIRIIHAPGGEADLARGLAQNGTRAERIWIATEKSRILPLRQIIHQDLGIARQQARLVAYWNRSTDPKG